MSSYTTKSKKREHPQIITPTKERFAWDFGLDHLETLMGTQDGIQCPVYLLRKFLKLKLKRDF